MPRQHCTNFPDIAQKNSQAYFEQKDKIVRNIHKFVQAKFVLTFAFGYKNVKKNWVEIPYR